MTKYSARFCQCGRIHLINNDLYDWMKEDFCHRSIIYVCQNCGTTFKVFLDEYMDGYAVNYVEVENIEANYDPNTIVFFNHGIAVPVMSGHYASAHTSSNRWVAENISGPEFSRVDTQTLIQEIRRDFKEDAENVLKSISSYVSGIDWKGTEYEFKF